VYLHHVRIRSRNYTLSSNPENDTGRGPDRWSGVSGSVETKAPTRSRRGAFDQNHAKLSELSCEATR